MDIIFYNSKRPYREIRAVFNQDIVRVYQAFSNEIALPALEAQTFVPPFKSEGIVSWIKPSFLWCMKRTHWGKFTRISKKNTLGENENNSLVLGIDVQRSFFDYILSIAFITHKEEFPEIDKETWRKNYQNAGVRIQWDPEKTLEGYERPFKAIQIGFKNDILKEYTMNIVRINNMVELITKIKAIEEFDNKILLLPDEKPYPVSDGIFNRLNMWKEK
jgi:hypothetical protein